MNIQEIIAHSIYAHDYEYTKWKDQDDEIRMTYKNIAAVILVALGNNGLHVTTIPRDIEADDPSETEQPKTNPNKGRSQH